MRSVASLLCFAQTALDVCRCACNSWCMLAAMACCGALVIDRMIAMPLAGFEQSYHAPSFSCCCAAVTFVAMGNGAPDLSANISAIRNGQARGYESYDRVACCISRYQLLPNTPSGTHWAVGSWLPSTTVTPSDSRRLTLHLIPRTSHLIASVLFCSCHCSCMRHDTCARAHVLLLLRGGGARCRWP